MHKGNELNNVRETWNRNERQDGAAPGRENAAAGTNLDKGLEQRIRREANEYDNADKEDRLLGGERASVNDGETPESGEE